MTGWWYSCHYRLMKRISLIKNKRRWPLKGTSKYLFSFNRRILGVLLRRFWKYLQNLKKKLSNWFSWFYEGCLIHKPETNKACVLSLLFLLKIYLQWNNVFFQIRIEASFLSLKGWLRSYFWRSPGDKNIR